MTAPTRARILTHRIRRCCFELPVLLVALACGPPAPDPDAPPIVLIVADDLGWGDVGYLGSPIPTPRIDQLAEEGMRLERFYVTPSCATTRAGIMTGRYPFRYGMTTPSDKHLRKAGLSLEEETLAERLARAGYRHRVAVGKWHLGTDPERFHPLRRGFTAFYGVTGGAVDYFTHRRSDGIRDWFRDLEPVKEQGYATDLIGAEAVRVIASAPDGEPFFLYVAFTAPHGPLGAKPTDVARLEAGPALAKLEDYRRPPFLPGRRYKPVYPAMVAALDEQVGAVLDALQRRGLADRALVWFLSDNGAARAGRNDPLRGHKATSYEGGIRVPSIVRWPGRLPGGARFDGVAAFVDVLPTLASAARADGSPRNPLDGIDLLPFLAGEPADPGRAVHPASRTLVTRDWKLRQGRLYDLRALAPKERDVTAKHPEVRERLKARLAEIRR